MGKATGCDVEDQRDFTVCQALEVDAHEHLRAHSVPDSAANY